MSGRFSDKHLLLGAALAQLVMRDYPLMIRERQGGENNLFEFSVGRGKAVVLFKYATRPKSPWYFTIMKSQLAAVLDPAIAIGEDRRFLALICHLDGVCLVDLNEVQRLIGDIDTQAGLSVARPAGGSYRVSGPNRKSLERTIPRSRWIDDILLR